MAKLKNCTGADVLPYHAYGGVKAELLGLSDNVDKNLIPTEDQINEFKEYIKKAR
jgi:hypothetical protein